MITHALRGEGFDASEDVVGPLVTGHTPNGHGYAGAGNQAVFSGHIIPSPVAFMENQRGELRTSDCTDALTKGGGKPGQGYAAVMTLAIRGRGDSSDLEVRTDGTANALLLPNGGRGGIGVGAVAIQAGAIRENPNSGPDGVGVQEGIAYTVEARAEVQAVAYQSAVDVADTLGVGANQTTGFKTEVASVGMAVRRLTPVECERLQGFPDFYTGIPGMADGPRYKCLGNSMAVPVMAWIGRRILEACK